MIKNYNQSKQYAIYLKSTKEWIPVSKIDFDNYYRDINAYRRRQQEHGRCVCPAKKRYLCDMDCFMCPYHKAGDMLSLNYAVSDGEGNEKSWLDDLEDDTPSIQSILEDQVLLEALSKKIEQLDPEQRRICKLIMQGVSGCKSGKALGLPRKTFTYRRDNLMNLLAEYLKDFL